MKRFPFLQTALIVTLMIVAVSCSMPRSASGGYYEEQEPVRRNVYYGNSNYGSNVIVVERDPFTGRYYQVSPYSTPYGYYSSPFDRNYDSRYYNNRNSYYNRGNNVQRGQTEEQRRESLRNMEEAKESILGKKLN